ncbi:hypothetical protein ACTFIR_011818 [Dictyostelium discoideum]
MNKQPSSGEPNWFSLFLIVEQVCLETCCFTQSSPLLLSIVEPPSMDSKLNKSFNVSSKILVSLIEDILSMTHCKMTIKINLYESSKQIGVTIIKPKEDEMKIDQDEMSKWKSIALENIFDRESLFQMIIIIQQL